MGSWNWTCFWSNLPIYSWERIVLIPIMALSDNWISGDIVYCDDIFEIAGPLLRWEYNDYGWITDIDKTDIWDSFLLTVNSFLKEWIIEWYSFWSATNLWWTKEESIESFVNNILSRGCVFEKKTFSFIMMHEDIFNASAWNLKMDYFKESIKKWQSKLDEILNSSKKEIENNPSLKKMIEDLISMSVEIPVGHSYQSYNPILRRMQKEFWANLEDFEDTQKFFEFVSMTRKVLFPMWWYGSQSEAGFIYSNLLKSSAKKFEEQDKRNNPAKYELKKKLKTWLN